MKTKLSIRSARAGLFAVALLVLLRLNLASAVGGEEQDALTTLDRYVRATYARDYEEAYSHIASPDQRLKDRASYVRDRGAFSGFTLEIARVLASYIELNSLLTQIDGGHARINIQFQVPDAGKLGRMLHGWDSDKLESLPNTERKALLARIDKLRRDHAIEMVGGEEVFQLIKEGDSWKVVLNWGSPVNVGFQTSIPTSVPIQAHLRHSDVLTRPGEIFKVVLNVKNTGQEQLFVRIGHLVDPYEVRDYLDLVDCGFLLPVRLAPGKEEEFVSTYLLRRNLPEGVRQLNVTYAVTLGQ